MVLPTGDFFPDHFDGDEASVRQLARRMQAHAGIEDIPVEVRVVAMEGASSGGSCSTGACAAPVASSASELPRLMDTGEGWVLHVFQPELGHPVVLTTVLGRALAHVFLYETLDEGQSIEAPADVTADLAAVALGLGALLLQGSYIYSKSCGGPSVARATRLGPDELAVAVALFAAVGGHSVRKLTRELDATQQAAFGEAWSWAGANGKLVEALRRDAAAVADGRFDLEEARPWLLRVLGKRKRGDAAALGELPDDVSVEQLEMMVASAPALRRAQPKAPDPRRDELKALVEEALGT